MPTRVGAAGKKRTISDGFQIYENGGATGSFAFYFPRRALYDLGRKDEGDKILMPMLDSFEKGGFQGFGPSGMTYDWKAWDGTPWGYEGFLSDNCNHGPAGRAGPRALSRQIAHQVWAGENNSHLGWQLNCHPWSKGKD